MKPHKILLIDFADKDEFKEWPIESERKYSDRELNVTELGLLKQTFIWAGKNLTTIKELSTPSYSDEVSVHIFTRYKIEGEIPQFLERFIREVIFKCHSFPSQMKNYKKYCDYYHLLFTSSTGSLEISQFHNGAVNVGITAKFLEWKVYLNYDSCDLSYIDHCNEIILMHNKHMGLLRKIYEFYVEQQFDKKPIPLVHHPDGITITPKTKQDLLDLFNSPVGYNGEKLLDWYLKEVYKIFKGKFDSILNKSLPMDEEKEKVLTLLS